MDRRNIQDLQLALVQVERMQAILREDIDAELRLILAAETPLVGSLAYCAPSIQYDICRRYLLNPELSFSELKDRLSQSISEQSIMDGDNQFFLNPSTLHILNQIYVQLT